MLTQFNEVNNLTDADALSVVALKHTQNSDEKLQEGQANEVSAGDLRNHLDDAAKHRLINDATPSPTTTYSGEKTQTLNDNLLAAFGARLLVPVQDITELKAIDTTVETDFKDKTLINVEDNGLYRLDRDSSDSEDLDKIVEPTTGVGRWIKMTSSINEHNNLSNIQGGITGQRNHISNAELTDLGDNTTHRGVTSGNPHSVTATEVGITIGDQQIAVGGAANTIGGSAGFEFDGNNLIIPGQIITPQEVYVGPTPLANPQGSNSVAIGNLAGNDGQGSSCVASGSAAAQTNQGMGSVAYGREAGQTNQGTFGSAFGFRSGNSGQGSDAIAIGRQSGELDQGANGIIISSSGSAENNTVAGHIVIKSSLADITYNGTAWSVSGGDLTVNETLHIGGGLQQAVTEITSATYTIEKTDFMIFADTSAQAITLTLPAIVAGLADDGRMFRVQKVFNNTNSLTITPQSPSVINNEASDTVTGIQNDALTYMANGGNWSIINRDTVSFGVIQQLTPGATQQLNLTLTKLAVFDTDTFETPGVLNADFANDLISVDHSESLSFGGDAFVIEFRVEVSNYPNNQELFCEIFIDGVASNIQDVRQTSNAFNTVLEARGLRRILAPKNIELRIAASNMGTATFETCEIIVERIGK